MVTSSRTWPGRGPARGPSDYESCIGTNLSVAADDVLLRQAADQNRNGNVGLQAVQARPCQLRVLSDLNTEVPLPSSRFCELASCFLDLFCEVEVVASRVPRPNAPVESGKDLGLDQQRPHRLKQVDKRVVKILGLPAAISRTDSQPPELARRVPLFICAEDFGNHR